jgi:hypothetical protein
MGQLGDAIDAKRQGDRSEDIDLSYWTVQPNRWTFQSEKIRHWVEQRLEGRVLNACAGKTELDYDGEIIRNDLDEDVDADYHIDVCELAAHFERGGFDTIVFDPPFSIYQANRSYEGRTVGDVAIAKRQFHELLRAGGSVIQFGFTTTCMPLALGYEREAVAIFNTLGQMNDYLGTVDRRLNEDIRSYSA